MKAIVEKLITALEDTDAELSRLRKDRRDSWSKDPINELVAEARAALDAPVSLAVGVDDEQNGFEQWAVSQKYDMECHPLHYLFLDSETWHARQGWREGVKFASLRARPAPEGFVLVPIEPTKAMLQAAWDECSQGSASDYADCYKAMIATTKRGEE